MTITRILMVTFIMISIMPITLSAQYEQCGNDFNCYYEIRSEIIEQQRREQELEQERYRNQQLQLQSEQLEEVQRQNELLEEQLTELNEQQELERERQEQLNERLEKLENLQQKPSKSRQQSPPPATNTP